MPEVVKPVFDRQTSAGLLSVGVFELYGSAWVKATLDGKEIMSAAGLGKLPKPQEKNGRTATHYCGRGTQNFAIFADEAQAVESALATIRAEYAATPDGLADVREGLVEDLKIARDIDREDRDAAWEREDERGAFVADRDGKIAAARNALAEFDAAHPEIKASLDPDAERAKAALLQDQINYRGE